MRYLVELNNKTEAGRSLLTIIRSIEKSEPGISLKSEKEWEEMTDLAIGKAIEKKRTGKFVSRKRIMELLDK